MKLNRLFPLWLPVRFLLILLLAFVAWQVWIFSRPLPRSFTEREMQVLESALSDALKPVESRIGDTPSRFGIARFFHDANDEATRSVRRLIDQRENWSVIESSPIQQFLSDVSRTLLQATSPGEIIHAGRRVDIDVIVAGEVLRVDSTDTSAHASVRVNIYDARSGEWLVAGVYESSWAPPPATRIRMEIRRLPRLLRLLPWLAFVAALPWLASPLIHRAVEQKSNLLSFMTLGSLTLLDLLPALLLWEFNLNRPGGVIRLLTLLVACSAWNWWASEKIADK